jgi:hypothetical protein
MKTTIDLPAALVRRLRMRAVHGQRSLKDVAADILRAGLAAQAVAENVMKKRKQRRRRPSDEASYICPTCGEQIVVPLDASGGTDQRYVEDCPVCCNPNVIHVELFGDGEPPRIWAAAE